MSKQKIVDAAFAEIGTSEHPDGTNKTKYGKWFGLDGVAWCAIFVSYCYDKAGYPIKGMGFTKGFAGCQTAYAYFKKNKLLVDDPQPGDIVLFDWNGDGRFDHTGIFLEEVDKYTFRTIEGNTSFTSDSNGGSVMCRSRKYRNTVFARIVK